MCGYHEPDFENIQKIRKCILFPGYLLDDCKVAAKFYLKKGKLEAGTRLIF
jgi:hypothetical protein